MRKKIKKSFLKSITLGERLRLRDDVLKRMQIREWVFNRVEKDDSILLTAESGSFGWTVEIDDIDWETYQKTKG
jgi:hypothetical protein